MRMRTRERDEYEAVRVWLLGGFRVSVGSRTIGEDRWRPEEGAALELYAKRLMELRNGIQEGACIHATLRAE